MSDAVRGFLRELEAEAGFAEGLLSRRFLTVFAQDDPRLDAIPSEDRERIRRHFLGAVTERMPREVDEKTMLSPAEVQSFRVMFGRAGEAIVADDDLAPETRETLRFLCPYCNDDGSRAEEDADLRAPPALPGTAGELKPVRDVPEGDADA